MNSVPVWKFWNPSSGLPGGLIGGIITAVAVWLVSLSIALWAGVILALAIIAVAAWLAVSYW